MTTEQKLKWAKQEAKEQRSQKGAALREVRALIEQLKIAKRALTYYGQHAIVDIDCGYTARVAMQKLETEE